LWGSDKESTLSTNLVEGKEKRSKKHKNVSPIFRPIFGTKLHQSSLFFLNKKKEKEFPKKRKRKRILFKENNFSVSSVLRDT
jgi:hypothetical protein